MTRAPAIAVAAGLAMSCARVDSAPDPRSRPDAGLTATAIPPTPCPTKATENSPCAREGTVCEYGTSPDPNCNVRFACVTDPAYGMYWAETHRATCATCSVPITDGAPCELGDAGTELACPPGPTHGLCACTSGPDGAHAHPPRWVCVVPTSGCPAERPLLGQPCSGALDCDYGACAFARGTRMVCESGVWEIEEARCP